METGNTILQQLKDNREYYSKSDGNFMSVENSLQAHRGLSRVAWVRDWVHRIGSDSHLDIGCKDGYTCLLLEAEGISCTGVDPSEDSVEEAKLKAQSVALGCNFVRAYAEDFEAGQVFDTVSCMEVIEHVVDVHKLMEKLCSLGNHVFITTPDANGRHGLRDAKRNQEHIRLFNKVELFDLGEQYGTVMDLRTTDDQLFMYLKVNGKN